MKRLNPHVGLRKTDEANKMSIIKLRLTNPLVHHVIPCKTLQDTHSAFKQHSVLVSRYISGRRGTKNIQNDC